MREKLRKPVEGLLVKTTIDYPFFNTRSIILFVFVFLQEFAIFDLPLVP